jgi:quinol monooxygenase YgiN
MMVMQDPAAADDRVTVAGHFIVKAGAVDAVLALWTELIEHVRAHEPGAELYLLAQDVADPAKLWLQEVYRDEAAFVAHGHSPVVRGFVDKLAPLIAERHLARTWKLVSVDRSPA